MRILLLFTLALSCACLPAQQPGPSADAAQSTAAFRSAVAGNWVGVLEYRDYSEPATSTKRVELPTWLTIRNNGSALAWHYVYDDGPGKIVVEDDLVELDAAGTTWAEAANGKPAERYAVAGAESLRDGRGTLVLTGHGSDNGKPSEQRVTLLLRRNLLTVLEEVRPAGSNADFVFRHAFRFTRAETPAPSPAK